MTELSREHLEKTLSVTEIYKSIQGESTWTGLPCIFVRLSGCPLRCVWCDTQYAFSGGQKLTIGAIREACRRLDVSLVEITGGEPLWQKDSPVLAAALLEDGRTVLCETSGALPIDMLPQEVIKIMDLKCPGSGECDKNDWANIDKLSPRDEVKFVIGDRADYEWSRSIVRKYGLCTRCNAVLFAPVFGWIEPRAIAEWILEDGLGVRLQLQVHKYIWPADRKGV